jgi:hypothetical protein
MAFTTSVKLLRLFALVINTVVLSAEDDKRVIQDDLISTLAIGHYRLASSPLTV